MADINNPHGVSDVNAENTSPKLVSYDALLRYHHQLIAALGLVQDTAGYKYGENGGTRTDFPEDVDSVAKTLDYLYDEVKKGAIEFASGYNAQAVKDVEFESNDGEDTNVYWINATVGDDIVNIKLDADVFAQDKFLESVQVVTVKTDESGTQTITSDKEGFNKEAFIENAPKPEGVLLDGVYFFYTWITKTGEKQFETDEDGNIITDEEGNAIVKEGDNPDIYEYSVIALKDIYGDIKGDDYITFDNEKTQIKAQVAEVKAEDKEPTIVATIPDGEDVETALTEAGIEFEKVETETEVEGETVITYVVKDADPAQLAELLPGVEISYTEVAGGKEWYVDSEDKTNLATAENLAEVANELQKQIEANDIKVDPVVYSTGATTDETKTQLLIDKVEGEDGKTTTHLGLNLNIMSDADIDNMFVLCGTTTKTVTPENVEEIMAMDDADAENTNLNISDGALAEELFGLDKKAKTFNEITIDGQK